MTTANEPTQNSAENSESSTEHDDTTQSAPSNSDGTSTENMPKDGEQTPKVVPLEDVFKLVEKARSEEKAKLYTKLEEQEGLLESLKSEREALAAKLREIEESSMSEDDKLKARLQDMEKKNEELIKQVESIGTQAAKKIEQFEVRAMIATETRGITDPDLREMLPDPSTASKEEAEKAIAKVKRLHAKLVAQQQANSTNQQSLEEQIEAEVRRRLGEHVPGGRGPGSNASISISDLSSVAKLTGDDYYKERARLREKVRKETGF